jgi:hypothetical protein
MPAAKIFLSSADIAAATGISKRQAQYLLTMFEQREQVIRNGRSKLVSIDVFSRYLSEQDGADPFEHKQEIKSFLREQKREAVR